MSISFPSHPSRSDFRFPESRVSPPLPRFHVVLYRKTGESLISVVKALRESTRYGEAEAMARMWQAHHLGRSRVLAAHKELAELYLERLRDAGLDVDLEAA